MTVKELISELNKFDEDREVLIADYELMEGEEVRGIYGDGIGNNSVTIYS